MSHVVLQTAERLNKVSAAYLFVKYFELKIV